MPIRNPFTRRQADDGALRSPLSIDSGLRTPPGFERIDTVGSKASSAVSISSRQSQDKGEYKMSGTHDKSPQSREFAAWMAFLDSLHEQGLPMRDPWVRIRVLTNICY